MIIKGQKLSEVDHKTLEILKSLDRAQFPFPWSEKSWEQAQLVDEYIVFYNVDITCFCLFLMSPLEKLAHLLKITVSQSDRGKGLGKELLRSAFMQFRLQGFVRSILEVETLNAPAIALYEGCGFKKIHLHKKFYSNGADAHIMEIYL
ncbi:hypothetical protein BIY24_08730 [Halobacteriovorax marinus]|uniref:GNAT family N-acetyltransferase n=1 Tax=Halobacteriovorax marinus TaxID=97084 RepID=UPI000BC32EC2|nr:GNAT family N-acetyltransferase [Halobacteriovorax marinus]ATH08032.1 hypothetical protein BIY24_08730 [Halobacteriovorax marinus]